MFKVSTSTLGSGDNWCEVTKGLLDTRGLMSLH